MNQERKDYTKHFSTPPYAPSRNFTEALLTAVFSGLFWGWIALWILGPIMHKPEGNMLLVNLSLGVATIMSLTTFDMQIYHVRKIRPITKSK